MREIIFRGIRKDNGRWVYGWIEQMGGLCFIRRCEVEPNTVGQFVCFDHNGNRVFEKDVLEDQDGMSEVEWVQEQFAFMLFRQNPSRYQHIEADGKLRFKEVIGNVVEHPHLLDGRDEA
ncbi:MULTISPECIES: YopX family protein [Paenibacillus]|uniref:YopX protein n=1 Tax=Paenibacillus pabuli TaxID=1472 RepID=A0A855XT76_9BACL|nr:MULTISPECIES: YopX family protein [Paenibacillus]PWW37370.1 YopX protein [Paenibacillus pabuli]PXW05512.1 YopX protein [Paenibacillus taichungensis]